jgi:hypothetical protein
VALVYHIVWWCTGGEQALPGAPGRECPNNSRLQTFVSTGTHSRDPPLWRPRSIEAGPETGVGASARFREAPSAFAPREPDASAQGLKQKRKPSSRGTVTWHFREFSNPARTDGLLLKHWVKCYRDATGRVQEHNAGPYPFAKYNKKACALFPCSASRPAAVPCRNSSQALALACSGIATDA